LPAHEAGPAFNLPAVGLLRNAGTSIMHRMTGGNGLKFFRETGSRHSLLAVPGCSLPAIGHLAARFRL
jgi:hypothetical protein